MSVNNNAAFNTKIFIPYEHFMVSHQLFGASIITRRYRRIIDKTQREIGYHLRGLSSDARSRPPGRSTTTSWQTKLTFPSLKYITISILHSSNSQQSSRRGYPQPLW